MNKNIVEKILVPYNKTENKMSVNEMYNLYVPIANYNKPGIMGYNARDFVIEDRQVSMRDQAKRFGLIYEKIYFSDTDIDLENVSTLILNTKDFSRLPIIGDYFSLIYVYGDSEHVQGYYNVICEVIEFTTEETKIELKEYVKLISSENIPLYTSVIWTGLLDADVMIENEYLISIGVLNFNRIPVVGEKFNLYYVYNGNIQDVFESYETARTYQTVCEIVEIITNESGTTIAKIKILDAVSTKGGIGNTGRGYYNLPLTVFAGGIAAVVSEELYDKINVGDYIVSTNNIIYTTGIEKVAIGDVNTVRAKVKTSTTPQEFRLFIEEVKVGNFRGPRGEAALPIKILGTVYYDTAYEDEYPEGYIEEKGLLPLPAFIDSEEGTAYLVDDVEVEGQYDLYIHNFDSENWVIVNNWGGIPGRGISNIYAVSHSEEDDETITNLNIVYTDGTVDENAIQIHAKNGANGQDGTVIESIFIQGPSTATQGTLTVAQVNTLGRNDENYIVFNNEIYNLQDKEHDSGYLIYSHIGHNSTNDFMIKCITITKSTRSWVLTEKKITNEYDLIITSDSDFVKFASDCWNGECDAKNVLLLNATNVPITWTTYVGIWLPDNIRKIQVIGDITINVNDANYFSIGIGWVQPYIGDPDEEPDYDDPDIGNNPGVIIGMKLNYYEIIQARNIRAAFYNCKCIDCEGTATVNSSYVAGIASAAHSCGYLKNCKMNYINTSVSSTSVVEAYCNCGNIHNCDVADDNLMFYNCDRLYDCITTAKFEGCIRLTNCKSTESFFSVCKNLINCECTGNKTYGFDNCERLINCVVDANMAYPFRNSKYLTNCRAKATVPGSSSSGLFNGCKGLVNCNGFREGTTTGYIYYSCSVISNCRARNINNDTVYSGTIWGGTITQRDDNTCDI